MDAFDGLGRGQFADRTELALDSGRPAGCHAAGIDNPQVGRPSGETGACNGMRDFPLTDFAKCPGQQGGGCCFGIFHITIEYQCMLAAWIDFDLVDSCQGMVSNSGTWLAVGGCLSGIECCKHEPARGSGTLG